MSCLNGGGGGRSAAPQPPLTVHSPVYACKNIQTCTRSSTWGVMSAQGSSRFGLSSGLSLPSWPSQRSRPVWVPKEIWGLQGAKAEVGEVCVHSPPGGRTTPDGRPHAGRRRSRATAEGGPGAAPRSHDAPGLGAASGEGEGEGEGGGRGRQKGWVSRDRQGQNAWWAGLHLNNGRGQVRGRGQRGWRQEGPNACWAGP